VNLHWGIPPLYLGFAERRFWRQRATIDLFGRGVPTLATEDAVIVAAINLTKEHWRVRLHAVLDVLVGLRRFTGERWTALRRRARRIGAERALLAAAYVCARFFPQALAIEVKHQCRAHKAAARAGEELVRQLFGKAPQPGTYVTYVFPYARDYELALEDRWWRRARSLLGRAIRPNAADQAALPLPHWLRPLHWFIRPVRLVLSRIPFAH
jgi:hypothetical protein